MSYNTVDIADTAFINYLTKLFNLSIGDLRCMVKEIHSEMQKGLSGYSSSIKMIPSFVGLPDGSEEGSFLALDLGGTNFRVVEVVLDGKGKASTEASSKYTLKKKDIQGTGAQLFDFIAECIKEFINEYSLDLHKTYELGFTFSFPVEQTNVAAGALISWCKGFTSTGVEGEDVVVLLNEALKRKDINNVKVAALVNDTVGTLVAKNYSVSDCDIGVILGTGTNACYCEKMLNITKWRGISHRDSMIINMEWGIFDKLPFTYYDRTLDKQTENVQDHLMEKMVSGMYLGELTRLVLKDMANREICFFDRDLSHFTRNGSFKTEYMSRIVEDESDTLSDIEEFMKEFGFISINLESKQILKDICSIIAKRSARISSTAIAAVILWKDPELKETHTVGIDGSLFEKFPGYCDMMYSTLKEHFGSKIKNVKLETAKDGSGKGAAIIAAIAAKSEQE